MNKFVLSTLLMGQVAMGAVWTSVDDPRCHDDPNNPVVPPNPSPTPFPPAPTPKTVYEPPAVTPPPTAKCPGTVSGFAIYDLHSGTNVMELYDGATVELSKMPDSFTVAVLASEDAGQIKTFLDGTLIGSDSSAPYLYSSNAFLKLYEEGTFTLSAMGMDNADCAVTITTDYANPNDGECDGLIQQFALMDTETGKIVPGYEMLTTNQILGMDSLPNGEGGQLTLVAITNGRDSGTVYFGISRGHDVTYKHTSTQVPHVATPKQSTGKYLPMVDITLGGTFTLWAKSKSMLGNIEDDSKACEITLHVEPHSECPNLITGFSVIDTQTHLPVPGFENIHGARALALAVDTVSTTITVVAHVKTNSMGQPLADQVMFQVGSGKKFAQTTAPFALNAFTNDKQLGILYKTYNAISKSGTYVILAYGRNKSTKQWETLDTDSCYLTLVATTKKQYNTIDDDKYCAPELVVPAMEGAILPEVPPINVISRVVNETIKFRTNNTVSSDVGWITTSFVTKSMVEVCDMDEDTPWYSLSNRTYEAKCFDGFAFVDVYVYSPSNTKALADTSFLPLPCKKDVDIGGVVKYTYVLPCDCAVEIPDTFLGGPNEKNAQCNYRTAYVWGEPHINAFDDREEWDCYEEGEFVLSKAELTGYDYDFEMRGRFTKFQQSNLPWSLHSAVAISHGPTIQIAMANTTNHKSTKMGNLDIHFIVNGEYRYFSEGTGYHDITVTVDGFTIYLIFARTGISVRIKVRPFVVDNHGNIMNSRRNNWIPGSFSTFLCMPEGNPGITNVRGLLGTPNRDAKDDFMSVLGTTIPKPSGKVKNSYCRTWCIRDEADSLFVFEEGFGFDLFNKCGAPNTSRRLLTEEEEESFDVNVFLSKCTSECDEILAVCEEANYNRACLLDGYALGLPGALAAVDDMAQEAITAEADMARADTNSLACCSDETGTQCHDTCTYQQGFNPFNDKCSVCVGSPSYWMPYGDIEMFPPNGDEVGCLANGVSCDSDDFCCGSMKCGLGSKVCEMPSDDSANNGRRLLGADFKPIRPDLDLDVRSIVPFHEEL